MPAKLVQHWSLHGTKGIRHLLVFADADSLLCCPQNEFRIDSSRLQPEDKGMMFRLMYFFMSFHHQKHQEAIKSVAEARGKGATESPKFELGYVLETMDLMSFNLVLREAETSIAEKNTKRLAECVLVLKEMIHIVVSLDFGGCHSRDYRVIIRGRCALLLSSALKSFTILLLLLSTVHISASAVRTSMLSQTKRRLQNLV